MIKLSSVRVSVCLMMMVFIKVIRSSGLNDDLNKKKTSGRFYSAVLFVVGVFVVLVCVLWGKGLFGEGGWVEG